MTLPASGAISWTDIRDEFRQSGAFSLTQCYRANASSVVPFTAGTTGIPASGTISASNFLGRSGFPSFQTFVAGAMTVTDKASVVHAQHGFDLNYNTPASNSGSSHGTLLIGGNNKRAIVNAVKWISSGTYSPVPVVTMAFVQGGNINTIGAPASSASDLNLFNSNGGQSGTLLNGKTIRIK